MISNYDIEERRKAKMRSDDRIFVLEPVAGKNARTVHGNIDTRLFNGENNLHVIYDETKGMWRLKYDKGGIPEPLKQNFTTFSAAQEAVTKYFKTRNVEVIKVID